MTATWQLADCNAGDGGFTCVPGSHKSRFSLPIGVRTCDDDMDLVVQPELKAGDMIFFMDGAQAHGTLPWTSAAPSRSVLFKYAGRTATRTGASTELSAPEIYWDQEVVEDMTPEQRAVMYGPCSNSGGGRVYLEVDEDGVVRLG